MLQKITIFITIIIIILTVFFFSQKPIKSPSVPLITPTPSINEVTPTSSPSATPTQKPLSFKEMNELYGPCVYLPTLMYHHIQNMDIAKTKNQASLTVDTTTFRQHLDYLKTKNYHPITPNQLISFFDQNTSLPSKPVLLTFDDAYLDNYTDAFPILKEYGFPATIFTPTGLIENPDYLNWNQINEMSQNQIYFGNHTWSHKNVQNDIKTAETEIATADKQLSDHHQNNPKTFAYPYGLYNQKTITILKNQNYTLAFTTKPNNILCAQNRFELPRIRVGNSALSAYNL